MLRGIYHAADADGTGGTEPTTPPAEGSTTDAVVKAFERLLERAKGDGVALAQQLYRENYEYRDQIRALKDKTPPEGALVLTGDAATLHQQYAALGRKPEEMAQALAELDTLRGQIKARERADTLAQAAEATGFKAAVLARLAGDLPVVVKDAEKGKKAAFVVDGDKETPLAAYAEAHWGDFLPALKAEAARPIGTPQPAQPKPATNGTVRADDRPLVRF